MWNKDEAKSNLRPNNNRFDTLVGENTQFKGDISFGGGLHIDGVVMGKITAHNGEDSVLTISEKANVTGDIHAPHIIVNGKIKGNIFASKELELLANAAILGDVHYKMIQMKLGAEINGQLIHTDGKQPVAKISVTRQKEPFSKLNAPEKQQLFHAKQEASGSK